MHIKKKITNFINNFGILKEYREDYYLQTLISEKVRFDVDKIEILFAKKQIETK